VGKQAEALREQLRVVQASLPGLEPREAGAEAKLRAEEAKSAAEVLAHDLETARARIVELETRLAGAGDPREAANARAAAQQAQAALAALLARLSDAGLGDEAARDDLLAVLRGPDALPAREATALLRTLAACRPVVQPARLASFLSATNLEAAEELAAATAKSLRGAPEWCRIIDTLSDRQPPPPPYCCPYPCPYCTLTPSLPLRGSTRPLTEDEVRRLAALLRSAEHPHSIKEVEELVHRNLRCAPVLTGHAASLAPYESDTLCPSPRTSRTRRVPRPVPVGHAVSLAPY
jgi:hypothetical protein